MILYNNQIVEFGKFPNGEINLRKIKIDPNFTRHVVTLKYESDADLFHLLLLREELEGISVNLRITYVPYSRMDRDNGTYTFSLKVFANFINSMNWESVIIYEPHSDVVTALLDRVQVVNVTASPLMQSKINTAFWPDDYQVFYPDAGAQKRYAESFLDKESLIGFKKRNFETGKILESHVIGERKSNNIAIVDDLCSKGGTFILAAQQLKALGFEKIILVVTHCEDTIFDGEVFTSGLIEKVITTDSILRPFLSVDKLTIVPLTDFKWT